MESVSLERSTIVADSTSNNEFGTVIGADANFKGDLSFDSAAKVLGKFEGSITSKGKIQVADGADMQSDGQGEGSLRRRPHRGQCRSDRRVELRPKGVITGDITAGSNDDG
jgi:cytoskeletal protein CcmA (bactofilin family)